MTKKQKLRRDVTGQQAFFQVHMNELRGMMSSGSQKGIEKVVTALQSVEGARLPEGICLSSQKIRYDPKPHHDRCILDATVQVTFPAVVCTKTLRMAEHLDPDGTGQPGDWYHGGEAKAMARAAEVIQRACDTVQHALQECLDPPAMSLQALLGRYDTVDFRPEVFQDIQKQTQGRSAKSFSEGAAALAASLMEGMEGGYAPPDALHGTITDVTVSLVPTSTFLRARAQGTYLLQDTRYALEAKEQEIPLLGDQDPCVPYDMEELFQSVQGALPSLIQDLLHGVAPIMSFLDETLPAPLQAVLALDRPDRRAIPRSVTGASTDTFARADKYILWGQSPKVYHGTPGASNSGRPLDITGLVQETEHPYTLRRRSPPKNVYEFADFVCLANDLYESMPLGDLNERPRVVFTWDAAFQEKFSQDPCRTMGQELRDFFLATLEEARERQKGLLQIAAQISALRLTQAELDILRYVCRTRRTWYSDAKQWVRTVPEITHMALGAFLDDLSQCQISIGGTSVPLISWTWRYSRKRAMEYKLYEPAEGLCQEALDYVHPRPYAPEDIHIFTTSGKERLREDILRSAQEGGPEELWQALTMIEAMPKTMQHDLIKVPEGEAFFQKFQGDDLTYARYVLEAIPGGKTLAKKIYDHAQEETT